MQIQNDQDLEGLRAIGRIVANCLKLMHSKIEIGMTTRELDEIGRTYLELHGAQSAPILVYNFPGATCICVNEQAAHGIPGDYRIQPGDLINIDVSAELNGFFADTGGSGIAPSQGPVDPIKEKVCRAAREALDAALLEARDGARLNLIGRAIEKVAASHQLSVIRNLCSHGVGRALHEEPDQILGYYEPKDRRVLTEGTVMTIEPFISNGADFVEDEGDGWTLRNHGFYTAQYEHTLVVTKSRPLIMTLPD